MDTLVFVALIWYGLGLLASAIDLVSSWKRGLDLRVGDLVGLIFLSSFGPILLLEYIDHLKEALFWVLDRRLIPGKKLTPGVKK